jgi:carboxyl-terminal processing protease
MVKQRKITTGILAGCVAVALIVGFAAGTRKDEIFAAISPMFGIETRGGARPDWSRLNEVFDALRNNFDGDLNNDTLVEGAKRGMVAATGDDYTVFMNAEEAEEFQKSLSGDVGAGVGIEVGMRNSVPTVVRTLRDNPAKAAGVLAGDVIVAVNDESVLGKSIEEVVQKVRGEVGTSVKLTISRGGQELEFNIVRATINNPSVELEFDGDVAVMTISRFDQNTGRLARDAANEINARGADKIILDLRGNGGGFVTAAESVMNLWIDGNQLLMTEKARGQVVDEMRSGRNAPLAGKRTIVLADGSSASASEIVVGALKDHGAATFVGEQTFGKGSVQNQINLRGGALLKVTIARWYTPDDLNINKSGIAPDVEVKMTLDDINNNNDVQLKRALEMLRQ